jgi:2-succinyl-6-hydroxy-2,4-cyclohexadiene-1-carboxylate synthase
MNPWSKATVAGVSNRCLSRHTVLALHGFTLAGAMFAELADQVEAKVVAPDLPGHGGRDQTSTSWQDAVSEVAAAIGAVRPDLVLGYSMGGRLALAAALRSPALVARMVLVSTSLGIADAAERQARREHDWKQADGIEAHGIATFLAAWGRNPMVRVDDSVIDLAAIRSQSSGAGIAGALRGMGQGEQPFQLPHLGTLGMPVVWVAGSLDHKYATIASQAAAASPQGSVEIVPAAPHNVVAASPERIAAIVAGQLSRQNV